MTMEWVNVDSNNLPEDGVPVLGFSKYWIDVDFNPQGIRECFYINDNLFGWRSAVWNPVFDEWDTDDTSIPEYWLPFPEHP